MANKIQIKRTSVSGRTPNTTNSGNGQYIDSGEFALNLADGILYSSNGSLIPIGANNVNVNVSNSINIGNSTSFVFANSTIIGGNGYNNPALFVPNINDPYWSFGAQANSTDFFMQTRFWGGGDTHHGFRILDTNGNTVPFKVDGTGSVYFNKLTANGNLGTAGQVLSSNSTGGLYWVSLGAATVNVDAQYTWTNTHNFTNTITVAAISSNGSTGTAGQVLTSNGTSTYWSTVNATGSSSVNVDAQYIWTNTQTFQNTITFSSTIDGTANNTLYVGSVTAANVVSNAQLQANLGNYQTTAGLAANVATLTSNNSVYFDGRSSSYFSNASNINTGTLPYSQLGTNVVNTTSNFSLSGVLTLNSNVVFNASIIDSTGNTGTTGQILTTNGANTYWSSKYYVGSLPPTYPNYGDTWYYTDMEKLFMWINDGGSDYWYDFLPPA